MLEMNQTNKKIFPCSPRTRFLVTAILSLVIGIGVIVPLVSRDAASPAMDETGKAPADTAFHPVVRFIVASDSHVMKEESANAKKVARMIQCCYDKVNESIFDEISSREPDGVESVTFNNSDFASSTAYAGNDVYTGIDALFFAGDLTNNGKPEQFDMFWKAVSSSLDEHTDFYAVLPRSHDGWSMTRREAHQYYTNLTGKPTDFHVVINGYHFIGLSASDDDKAAYDRGQLHWLEQQLDEAVAEHPDQPVFMIQHEPVRDTVYGSSAFDGWGEQNFGYIFEKYPQLVDLAGHTHYPLNDPRSVWQGNYTAIGTGGLYYGVLSDQTLKFPIDRENPLAKFDVSTCWVIEINRQHDLHMRGLNILTGEWLCDFIIPNPADTRNRDFTPEKRAAASRPPVFPTGAALCRVPSPDAYSVSFSAPAARPTAGMTVFVYRIAVYDEKGETVQSFPILSRFCTTARQSDVSFRLWNLTPGTYQVELTAETAYGVSSETLRTKIFLSDGAGLSPEDQVSKFFDRQYAE